MTDRVEITAYVTQDRRNSLAIWMGELNEFGDQVWIFLPKSQIRYELRGNRATISLPAWLADRASISSTARRLDDIEERITRIEKRLGLDRPLQNPGA